MQTAALPQPMVGAGVKEGARPGGGVVRPTPPSLYAEFLPKLGRISVVVHLPTPSTWKTKALVSSGGQNLLVYHEGVTTELALPARAALSGEHLPGEIPPGLVKMSWRLLPHRDELDAAGSGRPGVERGAVPWSALDLKPGVDVICRECDTVLVPKAKLWEWKDLPSENWAEMMEFWHCHKPTAHGHGKDDDEQALEDQQASRGYGANNAIVAQKGVGFVDLTKMLLHDDDLTMGLSIEDGSSSVPPPSPVALCPGCTTQLGHFENRKNGASLFKWKLKIVGDASVTTASPNAPTLSHCLAAALIATQARSGAGKVVLQGKEKAVTIWVLNPHIKFSCMERQRVPAMKLLFQSKAMDEEEIDLPDDVIMEVHAILQESNRYLPPDEKTKVVPGQDGSWTVALLERIER